MAAHMPSRLYRSRSQKMIAGVSGGLGDYFDVDPVLIRLLFVVTAFISGVGILAYIVLWIVVPFEGDDGPRLDSLRRDFDDLSGRVREHIDPIRGHTGSGAARNTAAAPAGATGTDGAAGVGGHAPAATTPTPTAPPTAAGSVPASAASTVTTATPAATATAPEDNESDDDDHLLSRALAHEDTTMSSEFVTTSTLPVRYDPAAAAGDPLGDPSGESQPAVAPPIAARASAPAASAPADVAASAPYLGAPSAAPSAPPRAWAGGPHTQPHAALPFGPPPFLPAGRVPLAPSERRRRRQHWAGAILIILGLLILGNNLGLLWWISPQYVLPLMLVGGGAWLLFGRGRRG